jgi:predicted nucleic acid-binding protein
MKEPILADTSVWINFLKGMESEEVAILTEYIREGDTVHLCPGIIQEILQGITDDQQFNEIREYLLAFDILNDDGVEMAIGAANLYRSLRKKGITIRKSNDCLIARYAIKHNVTVLHQDRDFDLIFQNHLLE